VSPRIRWWPAGVVAVALACARPASESPTAPLPRPGAPAPADRTGQGPSPVLPPHVAMFAGLMPLRSTGVDTFHVAYPTADGRGVIVAILDSGLDPGLPGLAETTTGRPKVLDLRDFSLEGRIALHPVAPDQGGVVTIDSIRLTGFGRVTRMSAGPYYGGVLREIDLGGEPEADVNGNGTITDELPMVVARSSAGWFMVTDTDGDGSLSNEEEVRDFLFAGETFTYGTGPLTFAVNLGEDEAGRPQLDLVFDNSGHGSHVAGIAAGHRLFGVEGFDGVAPGAQLLGLKIANNSRGGISVTGSMLRAMNYAADFAQRRNMPLVVNLSFGVGNEIEGTAAIDSLVDEFALKHPEVLVVISAGNDGPGISTLGFPGSADYAIAVCALYPGPFARAPEPGVPLAEDRVGWWSARGGEVSKPDICAPGIAFSNVPVWGTGKEISGGTSMAAPHIAGMAALLVSGLRDEGRRARAVDVKRALMSTATTVPSATVLDQGVGVPHAVRAYRWLLATHQTGIYHVRALPDGGNTSTGSAAYRRAGLASQADTIQRFDVVSVSGQPAARLVLRSDAAWLRSPRVVEPRRGAATITLGYDPARLAEPGLYVGTAWAFPATDTMAGPSFGLTNTVIVARSLETPFEDVGAVHPGEVRRHFLEVPDGAAGLFVELEATSGGQPTLFLFEPAGQPYRGGSEAKAGPDEPGVIAVAADAVIPGVYEAAVVGPPDDTVAYRLRAQLPQVAIAGVGPGLAVTLRNVSTEPQRARVGVRVVGSVRTTTVDGAGSERQLLELPVPSWAVGMTVDVSLARALWGQLTDFGVTVFDGQGRRISDGPLHYAFGRQEITWSAARPAAVTVELYPGFAHLRAAGTWRAEVTVAFSVAEPVALPVQGSSAIATLPLAAGATRTLTLAVDSSSVLALPPGAESFIEVVVEDGNGAKAVRRSPVVGGLLNTEGTRP
jgi:tripeptidyl-peptidase-2